VELHHSAGSIGSTTDGKVTKRGPLRKEDAVECVEVVAAIAREIENQTVYKYIL